MNEAGVPRTIRVLLDLDGWRAESVERSLGDQPDLEIVCQASPAVSSAEPVPGPPLDVVVTSQTSVGFERFKGSFFSDAGLPLVAINEEEGSVEVYDHWKVREVKLADLLTAIREVAQDREGSERAWRTR